MKIYFHEKNASKYNHKILGHTEYILSKNFERGAGDWRLHGDCH